ncbi:unnamed protein product [Prunus armeniaca]|uniref:Uncharacterized protein n=1 Tax=Prunus armeniaca TaxID=36596 RepID=A0A6J5WHK9_PRUAR|nr:unnamed protein product [Prunus armeniaca]
MNNNNPQRANEAAPVHGQPAGVSPWSMVTVEIVRARARRRWRQPDATSTFFDYTSGRYSWLLPGWVVEERRMPNSRLYRVTMSPYTFFFSIVVLVFLFM